MDFNNYSNPFMHIYREMLGKMYEQYLYHAGRKDYQVLKKLGQEQFQVSEETGSIDDILAQDSAAVLDKVKNTAISIAYRIKIHNGINEVFDSNWETIRSDILTLETFYHIKDRNAQRRRGTLMSELFKLYKNKADEEVQCWKDLKDEMKYFIHLFVLVAT
jgi:hypothetical protein